MNDKELHALAVLVVDYYLKKAAYHSTDRGIAVQGCFEWGQEKLPKYEEAIADGKKVNAKNFFTTCMACYMTNHYRKRKPAVDRF